MAYGIVCVAVVVVAVLVIRHRRLIAQIGRLKDWQEPPKQP